MNNNPIINPIIIISIIIITISEFMKMVLKNSIPNIPISPWFY